MTDVGAGQKRRTWRGHLGRITLTAAALVAGWSIPYAAPAAAAPAVYAAQTACSLLTHSQVSALMDASRWNVTLSKPTHCSWDTPSPQEATSTQIQLTIKNVSPGNTLVGKPESALVTFPLGCNGLVIERFGTTGEIGYYCVGRPPFSGANMTAQEGGVQISMSIVYGVAGARLDASALVADANAVLKELHA